MRLSLNSWKRRWTSICLGSPVLLVLIAASPAQSQTAIDLLHEYSSDSAIGQSAEALAAALAESSGGDLQLRIEAEADGSGEFLLRVREDPEVAVMALADSFALAEAVAQADLLHALYLVEDPEALHRALADDLGQSLAEAAEAENLVILGWWALGFRHIGEILRPVRQPADLVGQRLRAHRDPHNIAFFEHYGATVERMNFEQLRTYLSYGVVDALEDQIVDLSSRYVAPHITGVSLTGHRYEVLAVVVGRAFWDRLTPDQQTSLRAAVRESETAQRASLADAEKRARTALEQRGVPFLDVDRRAFVAAAETLLRQDPQPVRGWRERLWAGQ